MAEDNHRAVEWGRYDAEHQEVLRRIGDLERRMESLRGAEQEHASLEQRLSILENEYGAERQSEKNRRDRAWVLILAVVSGIVFPLVVGAVLTLFHLHSL
jgi:ferric-dicitrate binding protein FerR (iron transport regulator)